MIGMPNKEKVIKGLECCSKGAVTPYVATCRFCADCPYGENDIPCTRELARDALALLKEQEAKTVLYRKERSVNPGKALSGFCPKCSHTLIYGINKHFCGNCGQEVKWE